MAKGLPDFQSSVEATLTEVTSIQHGLDADKSASPSSGDAYLATDTAILYACFTDGSWTNIGNLYLLLAGGTMTGAIAMGTKKITGMGDPTAAQDAATKKYIDDLAALYLLLAGGTMSGNIVLAGTGVNIISGVDNALHRWLGGTTANKGGEVRVFGKDFAGLEAVVDILTPSASGVETNRMQITGMVDIATVIWRDITHLNLKLGGALDANSQLINNLPAPVSANDAARKTDVDTVDAKLDDVTVAQPSRVLGTTYQNGAKIRIVTYYVQGTIGSQAAIDIGASSPPTTEVGQFLPLDGQLETLLTIVVPPSYYYRIRQLTATISLTRTTEWDLH